MKKLLLVFFISLFFASSCSTFADQLKVLIPQTPPSNNLQLVQINTETRVIDVSLTQLPSPVSSIKTAIVGTPVETTQSGSPLPYCEEIGLAIIEAIRDKKGSLQGGGGNDRECRLDVQGLSGIEDEKIINDIAQKVFLAELWSKDEQVASGGPTGAVIGFKKDDVRCILRYEWHDAKCPTETECSLPSKERIYFLSLECQLMDETSPEQTPVISVVTQKP